jgi:hypothetical protein
MKKLKVLAFSSVALYFIAHSVFEFHNVLFGYDYTAWIMKQYEILTTYIAFPIVFIYLFKKL